MQLVLSKVLYSWDKTRREIVVEASDIYDYRNGQARIMVEGRERIVEYMFSHIQRDSEGELQATYFRDQAGLNTTLVVLND